MTAEVWFYIKAMRSRATPRSRAPYTIPAEVPPAAGRSRAI